MTEYEKLILRTSNLIYHRERLIEVHGDVSAGDTIDALNEVISQNLDRLVELLAKDR